MYLYLKRFEPWLQNDVILSERVMFFCGAANQRGSQPPHSSGFLDHKQRRTTVGRTPLGE
jgi:hypothetical protein